MSGDQHCQELLKIFFESMTYLTEFFIRCESMNDLAYTLGDAFVKFWKRMSSSSNVLQLHLPCFESIRRGSNSSSEGKDELRL